MSSLHRKFNRNIVKKEYKVFSQSWKNEKKYQKEQLENGETLKNPKLNKKPTFNQWINIVKNKQTFDMTPEVNNEQIDTEWEE